MNSVREEYCLLAFSESYRRLQMNRDRLALVAGQGRGAFDDSRNADDRGFRNRPISSCGGSAKSLDLSFEDKSRLMGQIVNRGHENNPAFVGD